MYAHAHTHSRWFTWNVKPYFLWKIKKIKNEMLTVLVLNCPLMAAGTVEDVGILNTCLIDVIHQHKQALFERIWYTSGKSKLEIIWVTPKDSQNVPRVTSYLTELQVGWHLTVSVTKHIIAIFFASASIKNTTGSETILLYKWINLAWVIKSFTTSIIPTKCGECYGASVKRMPFSLHK